MSEPTVKVTLVRSAIGTHPKHRRTLRALGLRRTWATRNHKLTPVVKGMVDQVSYLLKIEEIKG